MLVLAEQAIITFPDHKILTYRRKRISESGTTLKFSLYDRTCVRYDLIRPRSYCYGLRNSTNWDKRLTNSFDSFAGTTSCRWTSKSETQLSMFFVRKWGQNDRSYCWRARCPSTLYGWNGSYFWRISQRSNQFNRDQNEIVVDYVKDVKDVWHGKIVSYPQVVSKNGDNYINVT